MNFGFTSEQNLLRDQVRRFLNAKCPLPEVRRIAGAEPGYAPELWRQMGELGWLGLIVPETYGGVGLAWVDVVVVLEEMGRSLFPAPFISNTLAQWLLLEGGSEVQKRAHLPDLVSGARVAALGLLDEVDVFNADGVTLTGRVQAGGFVVDGMKRFVADAGAADVFFVAFRTGAAGEVRVAIVDRTWSGVEVTGSATLDATKRSGSLNLTNVRIPADALLPFADFAAVARLLDRGAVAVTAESVGAVEQALAITSQYAKDRVQFGAQIGRYQGVKHRLAEIFVDVESVRSLVYYAAWCIDQSPAELPRSASLAKAYAAESFPRIGIDVVQLHGAIGYTAEYDIQLYLKRTKWLRPIFGDQDYHYDRAFALSQTAAPAPRPVSARAQGPAS